MDNKTQAYVRKNNEWLPVPDDNDLHDHLVEQAEQAEQAETEGKDYLDQVLDDMTDSALRYEGFTLEPEDAGMITDYIEELRGRVEELETMLAGIPDKALPRLKLLADAVHDFVEASPVHEPGLSDDALVAFEALRLRLFRYEKAKKQA